MRITRAADIPTVKTPNGNTISVVAAAFDGAQESMVWSQCQEPGGFNPTHRKTAESILVILRGPLTLVTADREFVLETGDAVRLPAGTNHSIKNNSSESVQWITASPASMKFETPNGEGIEPAWLRGEFPPGGGSAQACHVVTGE